MKRIPFLLPALIASLGLIPVGRVAAQTFTTLHSFNGTTDGANSEAPLVLSGNTLFGTTFYGDGQYGSVYSVNTDGTGFINLFSFINGGGGANPAAGLIVLGTNLYGTTSSGGGNYGALFSVSTNGTGIVDLHPFTLQSTDGGVPAAGVILSGNALYGTTEEGGTQGDGVVYSISTNGSLFTILHSFTNGSDGQYPICVLALSGNTLYGTTEDGGAGDYGTVFSVNTDGTGYAILHVFSNTDGAHPHAGLFLWGNALYGTTVNGGTSSTGTPAGTIFRINTDGTGFMSLHTFSGAPNDGYWPYCVLVGSGTNLYGTTAYGGSADNGIVFEINTNGSGFSILHSFSLADNSKNADGVDPQAGLILCGYTLYGTAYNGGAYDYGTVFSLTLPPPPTTVDAVNHYSYGANFGWTDWRGDGTHGALIGEYVCSGYIYSANVGWINLGSGSPADGIYYQNNSASDFGVNQDGTGNLRGYAYGANIGWLNFENTGAPAVNLGTGILSGYVWSANCGWMSLSNAFAYVQVDSITPGVNSTGDGIPDAWALEYFGTVNINPKADSNNNGMTLLQDYLAGTDPTNPKAVLAISSVANSTTTPGSLTLQFAGNPSRAYVLQSKATLDDTSLWVDAMDLGVGATSATISTASTTAAYYRIRAYHPLMP
jgi:uncharacterized repeat protein (TIGR03803 family)